MYGWYSTLILYSYNAYNYQTYFRLELHSSFSGRITTQCVPHVGASLLQRLAVHAVVCSPFLTKLRLQVYVAVFPIGIVPVVLSTVPSTGLGSPSGFLYTKCIFCSFLPHSGAVLLHPVAVHSVILAPFITKFALQVYVAVSPIGIRPVSLSTAPSIGCVRAGQSVTKCIKMHKIKYMNYWTQFMDKKMTLNTFLYW